MGETMRRKMDRVGADMGAAQDLMTCPERPTYGDGGYIGPAVRWSVDDDTTTFCEECGADGTLLEGRMCQACADREFAEWTSPAY